ncbi:MAG: S-layer homology domain-containing protein [Oscillibacter sp.]|nr:S-layer homology domain-containing protein [Oscillibacter sp.]
MKQIKRAAALLLALAACLAYTIPALAESSTHYKDVPEDAYYFAAVDWADIRSITNGTSPTTFEPHGTCTRGQVVTFLWREADCPEPKSTSNPFKDVDKSSPFFKAILWACEQGITNGTSSTTFSPKNPCTRAHILTFLWRAEGKPTVTGPEDLADRKIAQGYWTDAYRWASRTGLLSVTGIEPSEPCPRCDVVYYLYHSPDLHPDNRGLIPAA